MYLISAEEYKSAGVQILMIKKIGEISPSMKNVHNGLVLKTFPI